MPLNLTVNGALATIALSRPRKLNALDLQSFLQFDEFLKSICASENIRGVIVCSSGGRAFSAGADINELQGIEPDEAAQRSSFRRSVFQRLSELPVPTIAAIDGLTLGGGLELALACNFRFATRHSTFALPEIKLGLLPGAGGTQRLPRLVGHAMALELMLTGKQITADEAQSIGLIDRIVDEPLQYAINFADGWLSYSKPAIAAILEAARHAELPLSDGLRAEGLQLATLTVGEDAAEGVRAFIEKRPPQFNHR